MESFKMDWEKNSQDVKSDEVEKVVLPTETTTGRVITSEEEKSLKEERKERGPDSWRDQK